jgi:large subunit ribosomal protein L17
MRHQKAGKKFNRDSKARAALLRSLAYALVREGHVVTTEPKAKTLRGLADRLMTTAKKGDLSARRNLQNFFGKRDAANTLIDRLAPLHQDRNSGYTTIQAVGVRAGDNAEMYEVRWMNMPSETGHLKNPTPAEKPSVKTSKPARTTAKPTKTDRTPAVKKTTRKTKAA